MRVYIPYDFPNWNEYINAERGNIYHANQIKQEEKKIVSLVVKEKYTGNYPVTLIIRPHFQNRRKDLDNFRLKGLIDGLVSCGAIKNDNLNCIDKIVIEAVFADDTGVEIDIEESEKI